MIYRIFLLLIFSTLVVTQVEAQTDRSLRGIYQHALNVEGLAEHFGYQLDAHPDSLRVYMLANEFVRKDYRLYKFETPVALVSDQQLGGGQIDRYFTVTNLQQQAQEITVTFEYHYPELRANAGRYVQGTARFVEQDGRWLMAHNQVEERPLNERMASALSTAN